jgi:hypothetical protein
VGDTSRLKAFEKEIDEEKALATICAAARRLNALADIR